MCAKWRLGNGACRRTERSEEEEEDAALLCAAKLLTAREGTSTGLHVLDGEKKGNNPLRRIINILFLKGVPGVFLQRVPSWLCIGVPCALSLPIVLNCERDVSGPLSWDVAEGKPS